MIIVADTTRPFLERFKDFAGLYDVWPRLDLLVYTPEVAMALAPLAVDPAKEHGFITAFLERWGSALDRRKGSRRR